MSDTTGLRRKIWIAFILQAAAISFAAVLGVYGASAVLKHLLIQRALTQEASHFWTRADINPAASVPDTFNMTGYLVHDSGSEIALPAPLRTLPDGYHSLPRSQGGSLVLVETRGPRTLYLLFKQEQVDALAFWFGVVPLALVLIVVYVIAWSTYRASKRAVSPVIWLASQVQRWDPKHPEVSALRPENLPMDVEGETLVLASSLHEFGMRIEELVHRERNFTRDASHELRTPLAVIRMASDMMQADEVCSPRQQKSLNRIQSSVRDMETLIEAFLILARDGDTGLPPEMLLASEMVEDALEQARPLVANKSVTLELVAGGDFQLVAPRRVVSVMLNNLIRNACYYTNEGHVRVHLAFGEIRIEDSGIGMSPEQLERVFEPFWRADISRQGGQGVGLSIVQRLSQRFGWPVHLASEAGQGTQATIRFPQAEPVQPTALV
jgi:signal transduction histidine kinase